ncbi:MAG: Ig-like domain-containing protein, partial [Limisphaerales bacterium]
MKRNQIQSNAPLKFFGAVCLCLAISASARADGSQSSADYVFTAESTDGGGLRSASTDYASDGSFDAGNLATSADYSQRGGYIGQLNNPPVPTNYVIVVYTNSTIKVPISKLLSTVSDADGDTITFVNVASRSAQNGAVGRSGIWLLYKPPNGFIGNDRFTWVAQDSEGDQATGTIVEQVVAPVEPDAPTLNLASIVFNQTPGATDATLRFASLPGETYTIQYTDSLQPPVTWTTLGTATTTNGMFHSRRCREKLILFNTPTAYN